MSLQARQGADDQLIYLTGALAAPEHEQNPILAAEPQESAAPGGIGSAEITANRISRGRCFAALGRRQGGDRLCVGGEHPLRKTEVDAGSQSGAKVRFMGKDGNTQEGGGGAGGYADKTAF